MVIAFDYIRDAEQWKVPAGVFSVDVDVRGGGYAGRVTATVPVTPGEILTIRVAEIAGRTLSTNRPFGGGGVGVDLAGGGSTSGGGASSIYRGSVPLVIAGGGGGAGRNDGLGAGGGLIGQNGSPPGNFGGGTPGGGGTQSTGGFAGLGGGATAGSYEVGGNAGGGGSPGSGGGGGYYGGGGGGGITGFFGETGAGGGGGSSYTAPSVSGVTHAQGFQLSGYGQVLIDVSPGECIAGMWTSKAVAPDFGGCHSVLLGVSLYIMFDGARFYRYDPELDTWQLLEPPPESMGPLTIYGNIIWAWCGGASGTSAYSYDPVTNAWTVRPSSPTGKYSAVAARIGSRSYVLRGTPPVAGTTTGSDSLLTYNHSSNTWTSVTLAPAPRHTGLAIAVLNRRIYIYGLNVTFSEAFGVGPPQGQGFRLNIASRTWTPLPLGPVGHGVKLPSMCSGSGRLWVSGGLVHSDVFATTMANPDGYGREAATNRVMSLAPGEAAWRVEPPMPGGRFAHASAIVDGVLRVVGGSSQRGFFAFSVPNVLPAVVPRCLKISGSSRSLVSGVDDTRVRFNDTHNPSLIVR